jgi:hypothetical protein
VNEHVSSRLLESLDEDKLYVITFKPFVWHCTPDYISYN